jgi:hypothetical protein
MTAQAVKFQRMGSDLELFILIDPLLLFFQMPSHDDFLHAAAFGTYEVVMMIRRQFVIGCTIRKPRLSYDIVFRQKTQFPIHRRPIGMYARRGYSRLYIRRRKQAALIGKSLDHGLPNLGKPITVSFHPFKNRVRLCHTLVATLMHKV